MELRQLKVFLSVVEHGGLARAATRLSLSELAVCRAVAQMEREIGVPLLVSSKGRILLTPAGEQFAKRAQAILDDCAGAVREARRFAFTGTLRVGITPGGVAGLAGSILRRLHEAFPGVDVEAVAVSMMEWSEAPRADLDLLLVRDPVRSDAARATALFDEPIVVTATPLLDLPKAPISLAQALELPMVRMVGATPTQFQKFWTLAFARGETAGNFRGEGVADADTLVASVAHGLGVAIGSPSLCHMYTNGGIVSYPIFDGPRVRGLVTSRIDDRRPLIDEAHRQIAHLVQTRAATALAEGAALAGADSLAGPWDGSESNSAATSDAPVDYRPTRREAQVLALICEGWTNQQIGRRLGITERTVRKHLTAVYNNSGVRGRAAAAAFWQRVRQ